MTLYTIIGTTKPVEIKIRYDKNGSNFVNKFEKEIEMRFIQSIILSDF